MNFFLKNVNDGSVFYLLNKDQFIVGRKDCDILISNDQSISRKHAIIRIKGDKITLEDYGSKYNTLFNGNKLEPNMEQELNSNDEIQFGVINSKFRLKKHKIVTTGTRLNSYQKIKLKNDLAVIGGQYIENWTSDCTHLTVEEITLTVKILHAIVDEIPIVEPAYWSKFAENVGENLPPPNIEKYNKPRIAEALLNNIEFKSNANRKCLFKGKLFVFATERGKKQMDEIIRKAGGTSISWEKNPMPLDDIKNSPKEFLIIQTTDCTDNPDLNEVIKHFSKQDKRTIPLQEIAMSIVLGSCEKHCNPSFNRIEEVFPISLPHEPTQNNALVPGTQSQCFAKKEYKEEDGVEIIIPDTIENELVPFKREPACEKFSEKSTTGRQTLKRLTNNDLEGNPFKKSKFDVSMPSTSNQSKVVKQERENHFLPKDTLTQKRTAKQEASLNESKNDIKENPFAFLNKNKKNKIEITSSSKNDNPFKALKKSTNDIPQLSDENPFKLASGINKRRNDDTLELSVSKKRKDGSNKDEIFSSTQISIDSDRSANFSKISKVSYANNNSFWFCKNTTANSSTHSNKNVENTVDAEMQRFIDQFKDTVIVEVITQIPKRPTIFLNVGDEGNYSKGKNNFKRFVKVKPIKPQRIIIGRDNSVAVGPRETTGIADSRREYHFSDDEVADNVKLKKKAPKIFVF